MQQVYDNGSRGKAQPFNKEVMEELLKNKDVDHVRIFNKGKNNVEVLRKKSGRRTDRRKKK